jgi:hypothetical protein
MRETDATFSMRPIGRIACPRTEAIDDDWGEIVSRVMLDRGPVRQPRWSRELTRGYWS